MSTLTQKAAKAACVLRPFAIGALLASGVYFAAGTPAGAATPYGHIVQARAGTPHAKAARGATEGKPETVEQRIDSLRAALMITADEETKWASVAQAMRDNAAAMAALGAEQAKVDPKSMTAVADLQAYQKFAQAHVDGLKNLIASFDTLYSALPADQKVNADHVFESFGRPHPHPHG